MVGLIPEMGDTIEISTETNIIDWCELFGGHDTINGGDGLD